MKRSDWVGFLVAGMLSGPALAEHVGVRPEAVRAVAAAEAAKIAQANTYFSSFFWKKSPGCSVSIRKDGDVVFERGYGSARLLAPGELEANRKPMTPKQRVRVASVSKPVLAMGILHLRDAMNRRGVELLDRTLAQIYPWEFKGTRFAKVTVRQILNHTAGFSREPAYLPRTLGNLPVAMGRSALSWSNGAAPGEKYEYSNVGYMLLADILTKESGTNYNEYLKKNIFEPTGMTASSFEDPVPLQNSGAVAEGYGKSGEGYQFQTIDRGRRTLLGSGGLLTTAEDLSRLAAAVQSRKLLTPSSWTQAFVPSRASIDAEEPYGLGWEPEGTKEGYFQEHSGAGYGATTLMQIMKGYRPPCAYTAVILCNFDSGTIKDFSVWGASRKMREIFCGLPNP